MVDQLVLKGLLIRFCFWRDWAEDRCHCSCRNSGAWLLGCIFPKNDENYSIYSV